jgi:hypothetical protein
MPETIFSATDWFGDTLAVQRLASKRGELLLAFDTGRAQVLIHLSPAEVRELAAALCGVADDA